MIKLIEAKITQGEVKINLIFQYASRTLNKYYPNVVAAFFNFQNWKPGELNPDNKRIGFKNTLKAIYLILEIQNASLPLIAVLTLNYRNISRFHL